MKKDIQLPSNYSKVAMPLQAEFHLNNGEVLVHPISIWKSMFIRKKDPDDVEKSSEKEAQDYYEFVIIPLLGKSSVYVGNLKAVLIMVEEFEFFVLKGSYLKHREPRIIDRISNKFNSIFKKGDEDA